MSLEATILLALTKKGQRQLNLTSTPSGKWQASVLRRTGSAYGVYTSADPVDALRGVLREFELEDDLIG